MSHAGEPLPSKCHALAVSPGFESFDLKHLWPRLLTIRLVYNAVAMKTRQSRDIDSARMGSVCLGLVLLLAFLSILEQTRLAARPTYVLALASLDSTHLSSMHAYTLP